MLWTIFATRCVFKNKRGASPDSVKGRDGKLPLPLRGLASDEVLCEVVGQLTGFPHERLVLQVPTRYLLVDVLQAHEKRPVAKPRTEDKKGDSYNPAVNKWNPSLFVVVVVVVVSLRWGCTVESGSRPSTWGPCCRPAGGGGAPSGVGEHCSGYRWSTKCQRSAAGGSPIEWAPRTGPRLSVWNEMKKIYIYILPSALTCRSKKKKTTMPVSREVLTFDLRKVADGIGLQRKEEKLINTPCTTEVWRLSYYWRPDVQTPPLPPPPSHRQLGPPVVIHHVQQRERFPQHVHADHVIETHAGDKRGCQGPTPSGSRTLNLMDKKTEKKTRIISKIFNGYFFAISRTGPCPDTSTHLSWNFLNILRGLWDRMTWSCVIWKLDARVRRGQVDRVGVRGGGFDNSQVFPGCERAGPLWFVGGSSPHSWRKPPAPRIVPESRPASRTPSWRRGSAAFLGPARRRCRTAARSEAAAGEGKDDDNNNNNNDDMLISQTGEKAFNAFFCYM